MSVAPLQHVQACPQRTEAEKVVSAVKALVADTARDFAKYTRGLTGSLQGEVWSDEPNLIYPET